MIAPLPDDPVLEPACGTAKILLSAVGGRLPGSDAGGISALMLSEIPKKERAIRRTGAFPSRSRPSPVQASNGALPPVRHPCFLFLAQGNGRLAAPQFPAFQINIGLAAQGPRSPRTAARFGDPVLVEPVEAHCSASHHPVLGLRRHSFEALHYHFRRAGEKAIRVWVVSRP